MLSSFCAMMHNVHILKEAEKIINSFSESENCRVWFEDEAGQRFVPHGNIKIKSFEYASISMRKENV